MTPAVSADFVRRLEALWAEFRAQDPATAQTQFNFWFNEEQLLDMASGYVPVSIRAAMVACLDWAEDDRRRAGRPLQPYRRHRQPETPAATADDIVDPRLPW